MTVLAAIEPVTVEVEAGASASATIRVRNQGARVDGFRIDVVGPTAAWAKVDPPVIQLFPRTEGEATVTFKPPRAATPRAGSLAFGIRIQSTSDPQVSIVEEADVTVGPFVALKSELSGRVARGWRSGAHTVAVRNAGNDIAHVAARALDPEEELRVAIDRPQLDVDPGGEGTLRVGVTPRRLLFWGSPRRRPYSIEVSEPTTGTETLSAVFEQRPLIPGWAIPLAGLILALVLAPTIIAWVTGGGTLGSPSPGAATQTPTAAPAETLAPATDASTPTPFPTPTPTLPPTLAPTPTPPTASSITIADHPVIAGSYLANDQRAQVVGSDLNVQVTFDVYSNTCDLDLRMPSDVSVGDFEFGDTVEGAFTCSAYLSPMHSSTGTLHIWERTASSVTGSFDFEAADDFGSELTFSGGFVGVFILPPI